MKETLIRLLSGVVYILLLVLATSYSYTSFLVLFGVFLIVCVVEFSALVGLNKIIPVVIAIGAYGLFSFFNTTDTTNLLLLAATLFVSARSIRFLFSNRFHFDKASRYIYLLGYIILPFILLTKLPLGKIGYNPKIIIGIFILIWTNDTFAYIVGKSIGKTKLLEKISPKKTIEGFAGGLLFALAAGYIIGEYYIGQPAAQWIFIALLASVFGTLGDLIESKFKRIAEVKDSGTIMPGHGGILDRLDSVVFTVPVVFLFYQIIYYVS